MKVITSVHNSVIQQLVMLHERKHRNGRQKFLVEGEHLVTLAAHYEHLLTILITEEALVKYQKIIASCQNVEVLIVSAAIIKKLSQHLHPQPIIGVCKMIVPAAPLNNNNIVIIDTIQDPGNLGNIIRTMAAFKMTELYLSPTSVDMYNHKVISASQGAIFTVAVYYQDLALLLGQVLAAGYQLYGTFLHQDNSMKLPNIKFSHKNAILFGNEGQGISKQFQAQITNNLIIPTSCEVESLNVATSIAIITYCLFASNILK